MRVVSISDRAEPVISYSIAKDACQQDQDHDRDFILDLVEDCADYAELETQSIVGEREIVAEFYEGESIRLRPGPVREISDIRDANENALTHEWQRWGTQDIVILTSAVTSYPITVEYVAGWNPLPGSLRRCILEDIAARYDHREGTEPGKPATHIARTYQHLRRQSPVA